MAPKRKQKRIPRRVNVRFKRQGDKEFAVGYTKNISVGGLFIGTIRPLPPGTEIVVEIKEDERTRRRPAMVVHAARVSALLATVRTSGMGVRFLDMEEADKAVAESGRKETEPTPEPAKQDERLAEQMTGPSDLEVDLSDIERFRDAFRRDIQHGLIFVPGPLALEAGEEVQVGVLVPGEDGEIALRARVDRETICRSEAYGDLGKPGFMLVFVEADSAVSRLRAAL